MNQLAMRLQRAHNSNLSRGDKILQEELEKKRREREERAVKIAEKERKRGEAMVAEGLAKGQEIRGLAALLAAKKPPPRWR